ncbi:isochorismatase family protein [Mesorhizobium sp. NBSH29]|uniref:cysteine hydrolase family protein n=1 Tax=Mesorhizobium sp. NBSH29 TaxID=2654249 RepID=UPI0018966D7B|nr:cysteine hydrolase [Mesorhizobium sp. NBSH29]QPC86342.1 isochorismatase family protein [Mesorhizobium sp. NBSH29]
MANPNGKKRELIEGKSALIVIDIQQSTFVKKEVRSIDHMPDYAERMARTRTVIDKAREVGIPVIFIQEIHRANLIDFGRELDGDEDVHCLDSNPETEVAKEVLGFRKDDYLIQKRRYSAFYGTDLEILLKGLKAETLILTGGLTDVCVHYTYADAHQGDYFCRVIEDCVGGSSLEAHNASLRAMEYLQTGAVRQMDEVLQAMDAQR